jgi:hypothetical protein
MHAQIQEFVATLNRELVAHTAHPLEADERNTLVPVVNARPPAPAARRR